MSEISPVLLEDAPCPLGCPPEDYMVLVGRDRLHNLPGQFPVVRCNTCGLMRTTPRPTPGTMGFYYPENYGPYLGTRVSQESTTHSSWARKLTGLVFKLPIQFNTEILPPLRKGRFLEVGCAAGSFLHKMACDGWVVEGVEFSAKAAEAARRQGYHVYTGSLESAPEPEQPFDLIAGWMVLEHLHDPIEGLRKLLGWAKPGAWLAVSVPNAGSLEFHLFKEKWYALQVPTHLYHFTPETLRLVLAESGWSLEKIYHQRMLSNLIASTGHVLLERGAGRLGRKLIDLPDHSGGWPFVLYPLARLMSLFGQTGRMTVWARKSP